jgi:hypothetical protein
MVELDLASAGIFGGIQARPIKTKTMQDSMSRKDSLAGAALYNQRLDAGELNATATGVQKIMEAGNRHHFRMDSH